MSPSQLDLVMDWDGTLTESDTLAVVASAGYKQDADQIPPFATFSAAYLEDVRVHTRDYKPVAQERETLTEELKWLDSLNKCEERSVLRVEKAGVFRNVTADDTCRAAQGAVLDGRVMLRSGWTRLFRDVINDGGEIRIVSVNWSGRFSRQCLMTSNEMQLDHEKLEGSLISGITIIANEVLGGPKGRLNRHFLNPVTGIWTAQHKLRAMMASVRETRAVYIGDSVSDLACLMTYGVFSICIRSTEMTGEQKKLADTLQRLGIGVRNLSEPCSLADVDRDWLGKPRWIYSAANLHEVRDALLRTKHGMPTA